MESTSRQLVSDISAELKALNIDERISNRFILSRLTDKTRTIIKQDADARKLFKTTNVWKTIKCVDLCEVDFTECACNIPNCKVVMKSKLKLPKTFDSNYGTLLKVFTINGEKEYIQTSLSGYIDIQSREYSNKNIKYFWLDDSYIYIPDSQVESVMISGLFENPYEADIFAGVEGAECLKPLDYLFPCPGHLLDAVKTATISELAQIYKRIPEDEKPNMNSNIKV